MKTWISLATLCAAVQTSRAYELHEWGTFTTVSGSDGVLLSGLQREEERLPPFLHAHFGLENGQPPSVAEYARIQRTHGTPGFNPPATKGLGERPVSGVTVKMETPVIYFHSPTAFKARVQVGFKGGTISQWYPARSGGETLPEPPPPADPAKTPTPLEKWNLDFSKPYTGGIEWEVDVLTPEESRSTVTFKPRDSINWLRARVPEANVVRTASGETENYLFYRGIGNFSPGLRTTVSSDETLRLENNTGGGIPYLMVFEQSAGKIRWHARNEGLSPGASAEIAETSLVSTGNEFPSEIYQSMKSGLTSAGLRASEADAMVQTWWTSYFERDGLRVFWILPAAATERILPLTATPAPQKTVRVLVGRSEVLRPRLETEWLANSRLTGDKAQPWQYLVSSDRFGLAIQERVKALAKAPSATAGR